jgi:hypothetical protein
MFTLSYLRNIYETTKINSLLQCSNKYQGTVIGIAGFLLFFRLYLWIINLCSEGQRSLYV